MKKTVKTAATKAVTTTATKTGEHVGKEAGDKIIQLLSKSSTPRKVTFDEGAKPGEEIFQILSKSNGKVNPTKRIIQQDINQRLNLILSDD